MKFITALLFSQMALAGAPKEVEKNSIKQMTGCYEVTFQFAETVGLVEGYQFHPPYRSSAYEWIFVEDETKNRISLQHILITKMGTQKHWRQDWLYEAKERFNYSGNMTWHKVMMKNSDGEWLQRVYQVDDSWRYQCSAPWVINPHRQYWECETWGPLPRREFSKRSDYNVLQRRNRHEVLPEGWNHEEDNTKLLVNDIGVQPLAMEKGWNTYRKVDESVCAPAKDHWNKFGERWKFVRSEFDAFEEKCYELSVKKPAGRGPLFEELFRIVEADDSQKFTSQEFKVAVRKALRDYVNCKY